MITLWIIFAVLVVLALFPDARSREMGRLVDSMYEAAERADRRRQENIDAITEYVWSNRDEIIVKLRLHGFAEIPYPDGVFTIKSRDIS